MGVAGIMNINIFLLWLIKSREALGSGCFKNNVFNFFYFYFSQEIHLFLSWYVSNCQIKNLNGPIYFWTSFCCVNSGKMWNGLMVLNKNPSCPDFQVCEITKSSQILNVFILGRTDWRGKAVLLWTWKMHNRRWRTGGGGSGGFYRMVGLQSGLWRREAV